jgi:hypothetical protein
MAEETSSSSAPAEGSAKKSSTTKKSSKKAPAKRARSTNARAPRAEPSRKMTGSQVAERAVRQLGELTSKDIEGVTALQRTEDGWQLELEVLELRRIPSTTDVLATYQVGLDSSGELEEYRRLGRYVRGQAEDGA